CPVSVRITTKSTALSAGLPIEMACESAGSRPNARITWWLNGTQLSSHSETVHDNVTSSTLRLLPKLQHHRSPLLCRADNPKLFNSHLEDVRLLNITCGHTSGLPPPDQGRGGPAAQGGRLRAAGVRRGCQPPVLKVGWLFNDLPLSHNESRTDIVSGSTLVFKRLARQNRGRYRCYAFNEEGRGRQRRTRPQHQP
ncbi:irregular chiasm C-roughest protein, partial [Caerostris extrusa]